jgi:putative flippase GtrA
MVDDVTDVVSAAPAAAPGRGLLHVRFSRYTMLSLLTVPVGYTLLLIATHLWPHVNAGLLNLGVGMVLTPPSFFMYRWLVWKGGSGRSIPREMFSFWQTVMVGALASSALIAFVDVVFHATGPLIIFAGLCGQGIIFIARFFWLDKVTFTAKPNPTTKPNP